MKRLLIAALVASIAIPVSAITLPNRNTGAGTSRDVILDWNIPSSREDGSPLALTELAGYEVAMLCNADADTLIPVSGGSTDTLLIPNVPVGTCEFAISAQDTDGLDSAWSDVVTVSIKSGTGPKKINLSASQSSAQPATSPAR